MHRITTEELRSLRNDVPVAVVVDALDLDRRARGRRREFRCPACGGFTGAIHARENLARCFRCARNYNPIDLVMVVRRASFREAVDQLRGIARSRPSNEVPAVPRARQPVVKTNTIW